MKIYNLHTHNTFSDGDMSIEYVMAKAKEKGYGLGISDHIFCGGLDTLEDIKHYVEALQHYDVLRGIEANIGEDFSLPDAVAYGLDYCIASVHYFLDEQGERVWLSKYFGTRAKHHNLYVPVHNPSRNTYYMEQILKTVEHCFRTQRVDIYGHPTVLPFYEQLRGTTFLNQWEDAMISLCKKYDVALEISGLWREPGVELIQKARAHRVKLSFGCDGHKQEEVCNLAYVEQMIEEEGLSEGECYIPR